MCVRCHASLLVELGNLTTSTLLHEIKLHLNVNCLCKSSFLGLSLSKGLFLLFLILQMLISSLSLRPAPNALPETLSIQRSIFL